MWKPAKAPDDVVMRRAIPQVSIKQRALLGRGCCVAQLRVQLHASPLVIQRLGVFQRQVEEDSLDWQQLAVHALLQALQAPVLRQAVLRESFRLAAENIP